MTFRRATKPPKPSMRTLLLLLPLLLVPLLLSAPSPARSAAGALTSRPAAAAVSHLLHPPERLRPTALFPPQDDSSNYYQLVTRFRFPPVFASRLSPAARSTLLRRLSARSHPCRPASATPRLLVADLQNGLGNRIRALASAMEFAHRSNRVLIVLWAPDPHINATMEHLFDPRLLDVLIVIDKPVAWPVSPYDDLYEPWTPLVHVPRLPDQFAYFSLMSRDNDYRPTQHWIHGVAGKHVYVKTAYLLRSQWTDNRLVNSFVQALRPAAHVMRLVEEVERRAGGRKALGAMVGVHIRGRRLVADNEGVDYECEYSVHGAQRTDEWRRLSTAKQFVPEMHRVRRRWASVVKESYAMRGGRQVADEPRFFVAADSVATVQELEREFGSASVVYLPRACDDRSADCVVYALADMVVLSRTGMLLLSGWSSFSEVVGRLRVRPEGMDPSRNDGFLMRTSGQDFGRRNKWEVVWSTIKGWRNRGQWVSQEERREICRRRSRGW